MDAKREQMIRKITSDGEIVNKISAEADGDTFILRPHHTIADITRLIISQGWADEVEYFIKEARGEFDEEKKNERQSKHINTPSFCFRCEGQRISS